jgi:tRNA A-37 threonylcarbamoyl transferase component Bud32/TolB-like protein
VSEPDADALRRRLQSALGSELTVEETMGEGGFAVVFAVYDRALSRRIAVKVLRPELTASRSSKQRFVREAESVARLNHPHIMPIFFVGEAQGLVWFGMPLVEGETLEGRLRREGRLAETETARIGCEIAEALAEAHAAGLVHRDIKPLNIMLQGSRLRVLVADFGIAKAAAGSGEQLTEAGIAIGSPHYMSPEQASGSETVDHRSDIYSLGIVLWQMLAGALPFEAAESRAVVMQQLTRPLPRLRERRPDLSAELSAVVERCTAKEPADRYQSAEEVAAALRALAAAPAAPARRATAMRTAIAGAAVVLLTFGAWLWGRARPAEPEQPAGGALQAVSGPTTEQPVIAVLPFSVASQGDTAQFGRAAALMLAEALNLRNGVATIDGNDLLGRWLGEGRRSAAPLEEKARFAYRLGANQMIVGNYIESGRTFRLAVTMYDTHDASRLWGDEATGSTDSLFALLDRLASRAAQALCAQPAYNPGNVCFDAPPRARVPLVVSADAPLDSAPGFYARVSATGGITDVRIARLGADPALASRAIEALYATRFEPARKGGRAVEAWTAVEVSLRPSASAALAPAGDSAVPALASDPRCAEGREAARNPGGACFDARPVPRTSLPMVPPPASCRGTPTPATILVQVGADGRVAGRPELTGESDCAGFNAAALEAARAIGFEPARKNGRAVAAWTLLLVRPAVSLPVGVAGGAE